MALLNVYSNFKDNKVTVDFGKGKIVNLGDFADGTGVLQVEFQGGYDETKVGASGVASTRRVNNPSAKLTLKLKTYSDESELFRDWVLNDAFGETYPLNATIANATRGEKIALSGGFVKKDPNFQEGSKEEDTTWEILFMKSSRERLA